MGRKTGGGTEFRRNESLKSVNVNVSSVSHATSLSNDAIGYTVRLTGASAIESV